MLILDRLYDRQISKASNTLVINLTALLAILMCFPSMHNQFAFDDIEQIATYQGVIQKPQNNSLLDIFYFAGDPEYNRHAIDNGMLPWWSDERLSISFWRPVSELTHLLDYALFIDHPYSAFFAHIHSAIWYALLCAMVAALLLRMIPSRPVALLAILLFTIGSVHATAIGWLAARNALITSFFAVACFYAYVHWRESNSRFFVFVPLLLFALSLLSGEGGIATAAYLGMYELFTNKARFYKRFYPLLPFILLSVSWKLTYDYLGFGTAFSGHYVNPADDPWGFVESIFVRFPILLASQLFLVPPEVYNAYLELRTLMFGIACAFTLLFVFAYYRVLVVSKEMLMWGAMLVVSLLPYCSALPGERVLLIPSVAGYAFIAMLIYQNLYGERHAVNVRTPLRHYSQTFFLGWFVLLHIVLAPLIFYTKINLYSNIANYHLFNPMREMGTYQFNPDDHVFILNPPISNGMNFPAIKSQFGLNIPDKIAVMGSGLTGQTLSYCGNRCLDIESDDGFIQGPDSMTRSYSNPYKVGDTVRHKLFTAKIMGLNERDMPTKIRFMFKGNIYAPDYKFFAWREGQLVRAELPKRGEQIYLKDVDFLELTMKNVYNPAKAYPGFWLPEY